MPSQLLIQGRVAAVVRSRDEGPVAEVVVGEDVYTIRGADWIRAGDTVRVLVERVDAEESR